MRRHGPSTKGYLAERGHMGWATVVKAVDQLVSDEVLEPVGKLSKHPGERGKHAHLYALTGSSPLAIGVDVEHRTTRMVLTNLQGKILVEKRYPTPRDATGSAINPFLERTVQEFIARNQIDVHGIDGIGIGIPGIVFPTAEPRDNFRRAFTLEALLASVIPTKVRVESNTKAYAIFERWMNESFDQSDFIFASIRTGVGTGIIHHGNIYSGNHGLAGEIGHMKVLPDGPPCRCGSSGCMETVVNQYYLFEQYRSLVSRDTRWYTRPSLTRLHGGLADLFTRAKCGDENARMIVETAAQYLGRSLGNMMMVLDITNVIVSGHFGADGDAIVDPLSEAIRETVLSNVAFSVRYLPFHPDGHVQGAALLVLKDYLIEVQPAPTDDSDHVPGS